MAGIVRGDKVVLGWQLGDRWGRDVVEMVGGGGDGGLQEVRSVFYPLRREKRDRGW